MWTPEPWAYNADQRNFEQPFNLFPDTPLGTRMGMSQEDFDRASKCTYAVRDIPDPAAWVARAKAIEEAAQSVAACSATPFEQEVRSLASPRIALAMPGGVA